MECFLKNLSRINQNKAHNFVQSMIRARGMYVSQMKPKPLIKIGRWGKLMSDFQVVRQVVRQTNETI